jgi:hypothetical protein
MGSFALIVVGAVAGFVANQIMDSSRELLRRARGDRHAMRFSGTPRGELRDWYVWTSP